MAAACEFGHSTSAHGAPASPPGRERRERRTLHNCRPNSMTHHHINTAKHAMRGVDHQSPPAPCGPPSKAMTIHIGTQITATNSAHGNCRLSGKARSQPTLVATTTTAITRLLTAATISIFPLNCAASPAMTRRFSRKRRLRVVQGATVSLGRPLARFGDFAERFLSAFLQCRSVSRSIRLRERFQPLQLALERR